MKRFIIIYFLISSFNGFINSAAAAKERADYEIVPYGPIDKLEFMEAGIKCFVYTTNKNGGGKIIYKKFIHGDGRIQYEYFVEWYMPDLMSFNGRWAGGGLQLTDISSIVGRQYPTFEKLEADYNYQENMKACLIQ